ncbi:MAG: hypothetical protein ACI4J7_10910 [Ruminiclostridium sp.]
MMKKLIFIILALALIAVSSCGNTPAEYRADITDSEIKNADNEIISSFDITDDAIHCSVFYDSGNGIYKSKICVYESSGKKTQEYYFDEPNMPLNLVCQNQNTYYYTVPKLIDGKNEKYVIMRYNADNKTAEQVYAFENCSEVDRLELDNNNFFALINEGDNANGEKQLIMIDLENLASSVILSEAIIDFSVDSNGDLLILSEDNAGYCLTNYHTSENSFSEKIYKGLEGAFGICAYNGDKYIAYGQNIPSGAAIYSLYDDGNIPVFENRVQFSGNCRLENDKFYCLTTDGISITDISNALSQRLNDSISMVTSGNYLEAQSVNGFSVKQEIIDDEAFALTVLSNDTKYDLFYLRSRAGCAAEIRDKGAFYPLNEVDGVQEYLDSCFPFVKEAATNKDGDIWMLPILVQPSYIVYNEENCKKSGLNFYDGMPAEEFVDIVIRYYSEGNTDYDIFGTYIYVEQLLSDYIMKYNRFDTQDFRELASLIKNKIYKNEEAFCFGSHMTEMYEMNMTADRTEQSFALCFNSSNINIYERDWGESAKAMRVPLFTDSGTSISTCVFICVNPFSDNLDKTLEYISALSKNLVEQGAEDDERINRDKVMMLKNSAVYSRNKFFSEINNV